MNLQVTESENTLTPGSAAYYVARFAASSERVAVANWLAWFAQLDRIADNAKDPGVARLKLDWWHAEIDQLDQARHPLAKALAPQVQASWQFEQMHRVLQAIEQRILKRSPIDEDALFSQCDLFGGSRAILLANHADPDLQVQAAQLGRYLALVDRLVHLHRDLQQDYLSLPLMVLQQHGVDQTDLAAGEPVLNLAIALEALLAPYELPVLQAMRASRREPRLHNPLRQVAQAVHLVRRMRQKGFVGHAWRLSPLQYLWHAWRMR